MSRGALSAERGLTVRRALFILLAAALPLAAMAQAEQTVEVCDGVSLALVEIPAGEFTMGAPEDESPLDGDEGPASVVKIESAFLLGKFEITNQQYACFDAEHESGWMDTHGKDRVGPGVAINAPEMPVVRVSWERANEFCEWLGERLGKTFRLPTEAEWEYSCRAGTDGAFSFGDEASIAEHANSADQNLGRLKPWTVRDNSKNDGHVASAPVGTYAANAFGLHDMHGNVCEWTQTTYAPYPHAGADGDGPKVVRGGSWDDLPRRCRSAFRLSYVPFMAVYNVGFRVVVEK